MGTVLLINGPNLNLLGTREPSIYGTDTLNDVESDCIGLLLGRGIRTNCFQSNHEGAIIDRIHQAAGFDISGTPGAGQKADWIIINPGALTHTSVGIRDALVGVSIPFVEVHVSNVHAREEFRHKSFLSDKAVAVIAGLGTFGYRAAAQFVAEKMMGRGK